MEIVYFAKEKGKALTDHLNEIVQNWRDSIESLGLARIWSRNLTSYYANIIEGKDGLSFSGDDDELVHCVVPQARSLTKQLVTIVTKQKLAFTAIAESGEGYVLQDTTLADALVEQIVREKFVDAKSERNAEEAAITGSSYWKPTWNPSMGHTVTVDETDPENPRLIKTGDLEIATLSCHDVVYDFRIKEWSDLDYAICRVPRNKYDLAVGMKNENDRQKLLQMASRSHEDFGTMSDFGIAQQEEIIDTWEFYHRPTATLPRGKIVIFAEDIIIYEDDNNYHCIPIIPVRPEVIFNTGLGYPMYSNLLPMQEMLDHCFSAISTNQAAHAVPTILNPLGNDISVEQIGSLNFVNFNPIPNAPNGGAPFPLLLNPPSPEVFKFADMLRSHMMEVTNISGALRGSPPPGVTSGVAFSVLSTNSLEFMQSFSKAVNSALTQLMTMSVLIYKTFATEDMLVSVTGRNNQSLVKTFKGSDLGAVNRVSIQLENPLAQTQGGRLTMAQDMLTSGLITTPQKYLEVLESGNVKQMLDVQLSQERLIQNENDDLRQGKQCIVWDYDNHPSHIQNHASLLSDPEIRRNGEATQIILDHIADHTEKARTADPFVMAMVMTGTMPQSQPEVRVPGGQQNEMPEMQADEQQMPEQPMMEGM